MAKDTVGIDDCKHGYCYGTLHEYCYGTLHDDCKHGYSYGMLHVCLMCHKSRLQRYAHGRLVTDSGWTNRTSKAGETTTSVEDLRAIVDRHIDQISHHSKLTAALDELEAWRAAHTTIPYTTTTPLDQEGNDEDV